MKVSFVATSVCSLVLYCLDLYHYTLGEDNIIAIFTDNSLFFNYSPYAKVNAHIKALAFSHLHHPSLNCQNNDTAA